VDTTASKARRVQPALHSCCVLLPNAACFEKRCVVRCPMQSRLGNRWATRFGHGLLLQAAQPGNSVVSSKQREFAH